MKAYLSDRSRRISPLSNLRPLAVLAAIAVLASVAVQAHGQNGLRPPNDPEQKVIGQYRDVIHSVLDTMDSEDWDTRVDFDLDDNVLVGDRNKDVPLDIDELIQRSYTVKQDSALYQREVVPFLAKMQQMSPMEMAQAGKKLKMLRLEVQVHFNRAGADSHARTLPQLNVPGAAFSFLLEDQGPEKRAQTAVLLFGDWKSAREIDNGLAFRFKHPPHTAAIENVVIEMHGSPDRIQEVLHSADWKRVNEALTGSGS
jgi:hypothetical protein